MACVFLGKNEIRKIGRGEQVGRHMARKCHYAPLMEFYSTDCKRLTFLAWGRATRPDLSRRDIIINGRHYLRLARTETISVLSGSLQRPQPKVCELFREVWEFGMRWPENMTFVFLGKMKDRGIHHGDKVARQVA